MDPHHLDYRNCDVDSASYSGKAFQTMEGIAIYITIHKWRVTTLRNFKKFWFVYTVKFIKE